MRQSCMSAALQVGNVPTRCGGQVFADHSKTMGLVDVYASILDGYPFSPKIHANYESTALRIKDGLPKFKDFPEAFGGLGLMLEE